MVFTISEGPPISSVWPISIFPWPGTLTSALAGIDTTPPRFWLALRCSSSTRPVSVSLPGITWVSVSRIVMLPASSAGWSFASSASTGIRCTRLARLFTYNKPAPTTAPITSTMLTPDAISIFFSRFFRFGGPCDSGPRASAACRV